MRRYLEEVNPLLERIRAGGDTAQRRLGRLSQVRSQPLGARIRE